MSDPNFLIKVGRGGGGGGEGGVDRNKRERWRGGVKMFRIKVISTQKGREGGKPLSPSSTFATCTAQCSGIL